MCTRCCHKRKSEATKGGHALAALRAYSSAMGGLGESTVALLWQDSFGVQPF
jgi:hypothetical protein